MQESLIVVFVLILIGIGVAYNHDKSKAIKLNATWYNWPATRTAINISIVLIVVHIVLSLVISNYSVSIDYFVMTIAVFTVLGILRREIVRKTDIPI